MAQSSTKDKTTLGVLVLAALFAVVTMVLALGGSPALWWSFAGLVLLVVLAALTLWHSRRGH